MAQKKSHNKKTSEKKNRKSSEASNGSILWTLLLVLFLRGYIAEPFRIPSPSMEPTLMIGDHLLVSKSAYDLRIPFTNTSLLRVASPTRGDIVVFEFPSPRGARDVRAGKFFIKRVIGAPGDTIKVVNGEPVINGKTVDFDLFYQGENFTGIPAYDDVYMDGSQIIKERIPGHKNKWHWVQRIPSIADSNYFEGLGCGFIPGVDGMTEENGNVQNVCEFKIPKDKYFVMGDNREQSSDGRVWGLVDRKHLKGKALFVWLSTPSEPISINDPFWKSLVSFPKDLAKMLVTPKRLKRIGTKLR